MKILGQTTVAVSHFASGIYDRPVYVGWAQPSPTNENAPANRNTHSRQTQALEKFRSDANRRLLCRATSLLQVYLLVAAARICVPPYAKCACWRVCASEA